MFDSMKGTWLICTVLLVVSGCGISTPASEIVPKNEEKEVVSPQENIYQNTRFGYRITLPEGAVPYALTQEQTAISAQEDSGVIFFVEGETNFFTIRGIEGVRSPHEWLSQNLSFFYPTGDAAQQIVEFAGGQAFVLKGSGTASSPARLIVLPLNGNLIVISYEQDTKTFEDLVDSFERI